MSSIRTAPLLVALTFAGLAGIVTPSRAGEIHYIGRNAQTGGAIITVAGQRRLVALGDVLPEVGTVSEIDDTRMTCRHELSQAEKDTLRQRHAAVYDAVEALFPAEDLRIVPVPAR